MPTRTIDALGKATTIARDILGRPTLITHPGNATTPATTTALAYDQSGTDYNAPNQPNASKGALSRITDPSGTTTYQRDQFGRITRTTQTLQGLGDGATHTLATSYNAAGQIAHITYPGGGKLTHLYSSTGQLTGLNWNDLPLLTGIIYNPLGQPTSWTWRYANAATGAPSAAATRTYNSAGQLTKTNTIAYTWDSAGRVTAINENLLVPASTAQTDTSTTTLTVPWRAQYDALGRITQWSTAGKTATIAATGTTAAINATYYPATTNYSYDANGNPTATSATSTTAQGAWSQTQQYTTNATTNRLLGAVTTTKQGSAAPTTATIASTYNGAGEPITDGVRNYTYDAQRRIDSTSLLGANPAKTYYAHNILGQRIFKTEALFGVPTADAKKLGWAYAYDASGTLMGEYGMGGATSSGSTQHIYLPTTAGPLPVAAVINGQHYAVHADHLNTPRRLTAANKQVVWQWAFSAFGQKPPTTADKRFTNASTKPSTGTTTAAAVTYNLRYPGQVYDAESKLHYNYHRSYDPQTGRYTQPDPIGLDGGWNRYGYVGGNPLGYTDSSGHAIDIFIDFGFIGYDIYALIRDGECGLSGNLLALGLDIAGAAIPGVTGLGAASRGANNLVPHGFASADEFAQFGNNMRAGLGRAGYEKAEPILQGSAVTGKSFKTGQPFDVGRVSDFDVALADPSMLARAKELGIGLRSGGTRTGPLAERDLRALGVFDLSTQMGQQVGREVNFMIYNNPATAARRAPSMTLPGRK